MLCAALLAVFAGPLLHFVGHGAGVQGQALGYLLIVLPAVPAQLIALAGEGCMRGLSDLRSPLRILIIANSVNVALEVLTAAGCARSLIAGLMSALGRRCEPPRCQTADRQLPRRNGWDRSICGCTSAATCSR